MRGQRAIFTYCPQDMKSIIIRMQGFSLSLRPLMTAYLYRKKTGSAMALLVFYFSVS